MSESRTVVNIGQNYHVTGGSDQYMLSLAELLEANGHQVIPFAAANARNLPTPWSRYFPPSVNFARPGPVDVMRFVYSRPAAAAMRRLLREVKVDLAHLHIYYGQLTGSILQPLREAGVPTVQTLHEYKIVCPTSSLYAGGRICQQCDGRAFWHAAATRCNRGSLMRSALSALETYVSHALGAVDKISHFIAVSDFLRNKVIELGVPAQKITRVHNFVDCSKYVASVEPGRHLLYFGRLERNKGVYTLLDAIEPLRDTRLIIAGVGSQQAGVAAEIERRGMHHVQMVGFQCGEALHRLVKECICSVTPSEWFETFGLTLVESFAQGRPVIASAIGGMTEVVSDGSDGLLFPPGDVDALRGCLQWMWSHRNEAVVMGQHGRRKVEQQFSAQSHYDQMMEVYAKVEAC